MAAQPRPPTRALRTAVAAALAAVAGAHLVALAARAAVRKTPCFVAHYTLATLLAGGADLARTYDDRWFEAQTARVTPGVSDINVNPPTTALLLLPVAGLSYTDARIVWTAASVAILAAAVALLCREAGLGGPWAFSFAALAFLFQPVAADLGFANVYVLVLALATLAWRGYRTRNDALLGVALAAMLALKLAGSFLWLLLLVERRWRALAWAAGTLAALVVGTLPWIGVHAWLADAASLADAVRRPERAVTAYQSVPGFFHHLLSRSQPWNPAPVLDLPRLAAAASWAAVLLLLAAGLLVARLHPGDDLVFAAVLIAGVVASPMALDYTYATLLLPIAVALAWVRRRRSAGSWALLAAAIVPMAADLPYRSPRLASGALALLAYPKLGGAVLLWAWLLAAALAGRRTRVRGDAPALSPAPGEA
jgi:hypothetical protein